MFCDEMPAFFDRRVLLLPELHKGNAGMQEAGRAENSILKKVELTY